MAETRNSDDLSVVTVSATVLGQILGVGDRMVRHLAEEGVLQRNSHGKYLLLSSVKNYILTLKVSKSGDHIDAPLSDELDLDTEKAIHEHVKRQMSELKLQLIKGRLHKSEDVERVITDMFSRFRSKVEAMPAKLAKKVEGKKKEDIQGILQEEVVAALEELSAYNPADYYGDEFIDLDDDYLYTLGAEKDET